MTGLPAQPVLDALPADAAALLLRLAALAADLSGTARVALVGGAVRDVLLGVPSGSPDLDLVVAGADVRALAGATGWPYLWHPAYGNATLTLPDGSHADVVSARTETYPVAGAAPAVRPADLDADLARRDFSVNALALVPGEPALRGPPGAEADLSRRTLRPLNPHSLHDDASRLVRAARLAGRLRLSAHPELLAQVPDALAVAARTPRLDAELRLLLQEPAPGAAAAALDGWGAGALLPPGAAALLSRLDDQLPGAGLPLRGAALLSLSPDPQRLADRLGLGQRPLELLGRARGDRPFPEGSGEARLRALLDLAPAYAPLTGRALLAELGPGGLKAGPGLGALLAWLSTQRRAGRLRSQDDEWAAARRYLRGVRS